MMIDRGTKNIAMGNREPMTVLRRGSREEKMERRLEAIACSMDRWAVLQRAEREFPRSVNG